MKANQRSPPSRGRLLIALAVPGTSSDRKFADSSLEGGGCKLSVPRQRPAWISGSPSSRGGICKPGRHLRMRPKPFAIIAVCACIERRLAAHDPVTGLVDQLVDACPIASCGSARVKALSCPPTSKSWVSGWQPFCERGRGVESAPHWGVVSVLNLGRYRLKSSA
jgi:hypothetical protein